MKKESELKRSGLLFVWKTFSILFYCLVQRIVPLCTRYIHSLLAYNGLKLCGLNLVHTSSGLNILAIAIQCFIRYKNDRFNFDNDLSFWHSNKM